MRQMAAGQFKAKCLRVMSDVQRTHEEVLITKHGKPSVYRIVRNYGKDAGVSEVFGPHKVRHSGVAAYLELSNGDLRGAQSYSRHAYLNTLKHYDDNRQQLQKKAAEKLSGAIADIANLNWARYTLDSRWQCNSSNE